MMLSLVLLSSTFRNGMVQENNKYLNRRNYSSMPNLLNKHAIDLPSSNNVLKAFGFYLKRKGIPLAYLYKHWKKPSTID